MNMQAKIAALTPEQTARLDKVLQHANETARRQSRALLDALLSTENPSCGHAGHRCKPSHQNDWHAIDNVMRRVSGILTQAVPELLMLFAKERSRAAPQTAQELDAITRHSMEMLEYEMGVKIASWVLSCHFQLVCQGETRTNTADLHVDRIRGMVEPLIERALRGYTTADAAEFFKEEDL
jgi:hypothetical protein